MQKYMSKKVHENGFYCIKMHYDDKNCRQNDSFWCSAPTFLAIDLDFCFK